MKRIATLVAVTFGIATLAGRSHSESSTEIVASPARALPDSTTRDLATYGDYLIEFRAESDAEMTPSADELARGEGLVIRQITIALGKQRWIRPSLLNRPTLPKRMTIEDGGWVFHGNERTRLVVAGQPPITVGGAYLGVFTFATMEERSSLVLLSHFALANGRVKSELLRSSDPVDWALDGRSVSEVARTFESTTPDPAAAGYMAADPIKRWNHVASRKR